ncbi:MAG: glycoside hydrolase family 2 TIM barrel-domain containing protein [Bacteroidaceae bacterium]
MYYPYKDCEKYCAKNDPRPLIQCEYAHAMGNCGGFFLQKVLGLNPQISPNYQGGYIWDFVDQGLRGFNEDGKQIFTYGGDYGRYPATDHNFNCNGFIRPDREPNPEANEYRYFMQNIWTTPVDLKKGVVEVYNEFFFCDISNVRWFGSLFARARCLRKALRRL